MTESTDETQWQVEISQKVSCAIEFPTLVTLIRWGRVTHICVVKLTTIGSDNGLSPGRRQAFIWTNAGILLIRPLGTNFSEILIGIQTFSFKKMHLKMSSAKWRPFCLGLNVLTYLWSLTVPIWWIHHLYWTHPSTTVHCLYQCVSVYCAFLNKTHQNS